MEGDMLITEGLSTLQISATTPPTNSLTQGSQSSGNKKLTRSAAIDEEQTLLDFIRDTMLKSVKDRNIILRIEADLIQFVKEQQGRSALPFPSMSSYHRMLVHRISSLFNLDHNIDPIANCVVVSKNGGESVPEIRFRELLNRPNRVVILRREDEDEEGSTPQQQQEKKHTRSFLQRSQDYHRARARIFENSSFDEGTRNNRGGSGGSNRGSFNKSSSFGGYTSSLNSFNSFNSSISPASSGYKSLQGCSSQEWSEDFPPQQQHQQHPPPQLPLQQPQQIQQQYMQNPSPYYYQQIQQAPQQLVQQQYYPYYPYHQPPIQQPLQQIQQQAQPQIIYIPITTDLLQAHLSSMNLQYYNNPNMHTPMQQQPPNHHYPTQQRHNNFNSKKFIPK